MPRQQASRQQAREIVEEVVAAEGLDLLGWRDVPVDNSVLGERVKAVEPVMQQIFVGRPADLASEDDFERRLFIVRKVVSNRVYAMGTPEILQYYPVSMSARTIVYKGMVLVRQLAPYYRDLMDPRFETALALVHQRFATNTFPSWRLAHPYRMVAHNGEINTLRGNVNWMAARQASVSSGTLRRRHLEAVADFLRRPIGHRLLRQCDRVSRAGRLFAEPCDDDAHSGGLDRQSADGRGAARFLRISRCPDGALGRPSGDGVHGRAPDRRDA